MIELEQFIEMFEASEDASADERRDAEKSRDYYDGDQWTSAEKAELAKRQQPTATDNRIRRKVNFYLGSEKRGRSDPKAYPRNGESDEKTAVVATDSLRYVESNTRLDQKLSAVYENMMVEGYGGLEFQVEKRKTGFEIVVNRWNWDRLFYDPHSVEHDFSDAQYLGSIVWMDYKRALEKFPKNNEALELTKSETGVEAGSETFDDKPQKKLWITRGKRQRVRIIQMYYVDGGQWHVVHFTLGGVLSKSKVPFIDDEDKSYSPLLLQSAYVDRDGDRYGEVRDLISPQDETNKRRSKLLHMLSVRQVIMEEGAVSEEHGGVNGARQQLARPDGVVIVTPGMRFDILDQNDQVSGQAALLQESKAEMDLMGPNASQMGKGPQGQSGRAIIAQQQGGILESAHIFDRYISFKLRCYRTIWNLIKQYWNDQKIIRVTDDENAMKFVKLNNPVTVAEETIRNLKGQIPDEQMFELVHELAADSTSDETAFLENDISQMDMDIIIDVGPDMVTIQQEQFDQLAKMASAGVPIPPDVLIEASSLRNKKQLIEKMTGGGDDPEAQAAAQQQAQAQQEAQQMAFITDLENKQSVTEKNIAAAEKTAVETQRLVLEPITP